MPYKVVINLPSGENDELDEVFEKREAAHEFGLQWISEYDHGGEDLHNSNPGDYPDPEDEEDTDFEVIKVNG